MNEWQFCNVLHWLPTATSLLSVSVLCILLKALFATSLLMLPEPSPDRPAHAHQCPPL